MSALTPDCDPDLSNCGSPVGGASGPRVRSTLVLLAVLTASAFLATGGTAGAMAFLAGGVALLCAWVLVRRGARLVHRAVSGLAARTPAVVRRPGVPAPVA